MSSTSSSDSTPSGSSAAAPAPGPVGSSSRWERLRGTGPSSTLDELSSRFAESSVSTPTSADHCATGGVGSTPNARIVSGKSVFVLKSDDAASDLCCAPIGKGKMCFKPIHDCQVSSHRDKRRSSSSSVRAGIYVKCSDAADETRVVLNPVGPISLFRNSRELLILTTTANPSDWMLLFNDFKQEDEGRDDNLQPSRFQVDEAKRLQTPAKRPLKSLVDVDVVDLPVTEEQLITSGLNDYESVWNSSASAANLALPTTFSIGSLVKGLVSSVFRIGVALENINGEQVDSQVWSESAVGTLARRVTDLEIINGNAPSSSEFPPTVWDSLADLYEKSDTDRKGLKYFEEEFDRMFSAVQSLQTETNSSFRSLGSRLNEVEAFTLQRSPGPSREEFSILQEKIDILLSQSAQDKRRIETLESQIETGTERVEIRRGTILRSPRDVLAYLESFDSSSVDFGGFVDIYNLIYRIQVCIEGNLSLSDAIKAKKDVAALHITEDEAVVEFTFKAPVPSYFGGKKSEKSYIQKLPDYTSWRSENRKHGFAAEVDTYLPQVRSDVRTIIDNAYGDYPDLHSLARNVFDSSENLLNALVRYVDDTYKSLVAGGNGRADIWHLLTKIIRSLFEEGLAPHRSTPTGTSFSSKSSRSSIMIWGVLRTYSRSESIVSRGIKEHPVVMSSYPQWLVHNSGKKDAADAKASVSKLEEQLDKLKDIAATKKALSALESRVDSVKKVADKAAAARA